MFYIYGGQGLAMDSESKMRPGGREETQDCLKDVWAECLPMS